jgi:hypothetical protein
MRMKEHLIDKRVVQRALQEGLLDKDAYQRMLDELPDLSHKVQTAAESQALEAASASSIDDLDDDDYDDDEDDDEGDDGEPGGEVRANPAPAANPPVSDTIEMERPRIPGSYNPDY